MFIDFVIEVDLDPEFEDREFLYIQYGYHVLRGMRNSFIPLMIEPYMALAKSILNE